jgi:hypothetical protein
VKKWSFDLNAEMNVPVSIGTLNIKGENENSKTFCLTKDVLNRLVEDFVTKMDQFLFVEQELVINLKRKVLYEHCEII